MEGLREYRHALAAPSDGYSVAFGTIDALAGVDYGCIGVQGRDTPRCFATPVTEWPSI